MPATAHMKSHPANLDPPELIHSLLEGATKIINLRAEIYSLPKLEALVLVEAFDSTAEAKEAVVELRRLVQLGNAKLIASPSLTTQPGQRSRVGSGRAYDLIEN